MKITISCPWPDRVLWPNEARKTDRHVRSKVAADARDDGYKTALEALGGKALDVSGYISLHIIFCKVNRHRYDLDGALSACKPQLDGIAKALGLDDFFFEPITLSRMVGERNEVIYEFGL